MTYYVINNQLTGQPEYFVPDEETKVANEHLFCIVGGKEQADIKSAKNKQDYLEREAYRFYIAKEDINGNDTTWRNADLASDSEDGIYLVFNHETGLHEAVAGLSNAVTRTEEIKNKFINSCSWEVVELQELPKKRPPYSPEVYGETVGTIPVEVM